MMILAPGVLQLDDIVSQLDSHLRIIGGHSEILDDHTIDMLQSTRLNF